MKWEEMLAGALAVAASRTVGLLEGTLVYVIRRSKILS